MKFKTAIIDGDPLVYRSGFSIEKRDKENDCIVAEPMHHAFYNLNSMWNWITEEVQCSKTEVYLTSTDKSNFRFEVYPKYKGNRKNARRPIYFNEIREYLKFRRGAIVIHGMEADDMCSITQYKLNPLGFSEDSCNSVICSIDKDFNNVPGWHYNYVKDQLYFVTPLEALKHFYLQILTGDASDGVPRIKKGWKQKKAKEAIKKAQSEMELLDIVRKECILLDIENVDEEILWRGRLLHLLRYEGDIWHIPDLENKLL